ncbi:TPA: hypothetical protein ACQUHZ_000229, partial [Neisseria cinerea]
TPFFAFLFFDTRAFVLFPAIPKTKSGRNLSGKQHLSASFPRKRESRNPKLQEFIRNNRNLKNRIPACAGMTGL